MPSETLQLRPLTYFPSDPPVLLTLCYRRRGAESEQVPHDYRQGAQLAWASLGHEHVVQQRRAQGGRNSVIVAIVPPGRWQRALVVAILVVPLLVLVLLSMPAWLLWPFLDGERRSSVLEFLDRIVEWIKAIAG